MKDPKEQNTQEEIENLNIPVSFKEIKPVLKNFPTKKVKFRWF